MTVIASRLLTGACVLGTVFACGEDEVSRPAPPPSWISLSGDDPPPVPDAPLVLRLVLEAEGWAKLRDGRYGRRLGLALVDLPWASDRGLSLREGEREYVADAEAVLRGDMAPGHFGIRGDRLFVQPLAGSPPPGRMELLVPLDEGTSRDGRWRIRVAGLSSDGFLLSSAGSVERSRPTRYSSDRSRS